jgi:hypothetical protein
MNGTVFLLDLLHLDWASLPTQIAANGQCSKTFGIIYDTIGVISGKILGGKPIEALIKL